MVSYDNMGREIGEINVIIRPEGVITPALRAALSGRSTLTNLKQLRTPPEPKWSKVRVVGMAQY